MLYFKKKTICSLPYMCDSLVYMSRTFKPPVSAIETKQNVQKLLLLFYILNWHIRVPYLTHTVVPIPKSAHLTEHFTCC